MNKIVLDKRPSGLEEHELGRGAYGRCFLVSNNKVLKLYFTHERDIYPNIEKMSLIESPNFVFPKDLIYLKEISESGFIGYNMDFVEGDHFDVIDENVKMNIFLSALLKLEREIRRLTIDYNLKMFDIAYDNAFWTPNNEIKIIDTDLYTFSTLQFDDILVCNFSELNDLISDYIIRVNERKFKSDKLRKHAYDFYDGYLSASTYLFEILEEIRRELKEEVSDYKSFNKSIKLILKQ